MWQAHKGGIMAGIDKIYGTLKEYEKFKAWCKEEFPEALHFFYEWGDEWEWGNMEHPMTNFPEWVDKKLLKICPLDFVTDRIKEQYGIEEKKAKPKYINRRI
jgi:hypothetical protein